MNESKRGAKKNKHAPPEKATAKPVPINDDKRKGKDYSNEEIAAALGEEVVAPVKVKREKDVKIPKPRKFKTHSEKKASKNNSLGKK